MRTWSPALTPEVHPVKPWTVASLVIFVLGMAAGLLIRDVGSPAVAKEPPKRSPVEPVPDRDVYYPGTEPLAPDEMRIVAVIER